jgi:hypothetical protein
MINCKVDLSDLWVFRIRAHLMVNDPVEALRILRRGGKERGLRQAWAETRSAVLPQAWRSINPKDWYRLMIGASPLSPVYMLLATLWGRIWLEQFTPRLALLSLAQLFKERLPLRQQQNIVNRLNFNQLPKKGCRRLNNKYWHLLIEALAIALPG